MNKKKGKIILFLEIIFFFFLGCFSKPVYVLAEVANNHFQVKYPDIFGLHIDDTSSLGDYVCYFSNLGINIAISIAVLATVFGGVYYLVSFSRGKFTDEGKEWIKAGITGLLIVVCTSLIAYTINPALTSCTFNALSVIEINLPGEPAQAIPPDAKIATYNEIPIGTLTENLLTREMDCYSFDQNGNPIDGTQITTDHDGAMPGPTYMNHDRADCLTQLNDGAQEKGQVIAVLSDKITQLMNTCQCALGQCVNNCTCANPSCDINGANCKCAPGCENRGATCTQGAPPDCCKPGVKDKIEHGGIEISLDLSPNAAGGAGGFNNLSAPQYSSTNLIDTKVGSNIIVFGTQSNKTNAFSLTTACVGTGQSTCPVDQHCSGGVCIDGTVCSVASPCPYGQHCDFGSGICIDGNLCPSGFDAECINDEKCDLATHTCKCKADVVTYHGLDEFRCDPNPIAGDFQSCDGSAIKGFVEKTVQVNGRDVTIIIQDNWKKLNLIQQLTYFKEKITEIKAKIKKDEDELDKARTALGKCYFAVSYVDLLKTYGNNKMQDKLILKDPETFVDTVTNKPIDTSKYCDGFNYNNSSCFKKCNDQCPDNGDVAMGLYKACSDPADQDTCIKEAYNNRPCTRGDNKQNFSECIDTCQSDCKTTCNKKYPACATSNENQICLNQCNNNSKCVLDNTDTCLLDAENFQKCGENRNPANPDPGNDQYCITNAYLCKNGSDQYAGYPDCVEPSGVKCSLLDQEHCKTAARCNWNGAKCTDNYSATFFWDNPNYQKCPDPYTKAAVGAACHTNDNTTCEKACPETTKCPASSYCADCPCGKIDENLKFLVPDQRNPDDESTENYSELAKQVTAHQIAGPQCNTYSYNDDPLTFYCQDKIWTDSQREGLSNIPLGNDYTVDFGQKGEIPVGQTVDDAKKWAEKLIKGDTIEKDIQQMFDLMTKIGQADKPTNIIHDYCKCGAVMENNNPICSVGCQLTYIYGGTDALGNPISVPKCASTGCNGSPCKQMTDYLADLWNIYRQMKLDYIDFYTTMMKEPRSDIMKELTYSRYATNSCSKVSTTLSGQTRILSCTRAIEELVYPINKGGIIYEDNFVSDYCYGTKLGKEFDEDLTDNWFCMQLYNKNQSGSNNPIYNVTN